MCSRLSKVDPSVRTLTFQFLLWHCSCGKPKICIKSDRPGACKRIIKNHKESSCSSSSGISNRNFGRRFHLRSLHQRPPMQDVLYSPPTSKPGNVGPGFSSIRSSWLYLDKPQLKSRCHDVDTMNCWTLFPNLDLNFNCTWLSQSFCRASRKNMSLYGLYHLRTTGQKRSGLQPLATTCNHLYWL
jgi:hypothetical protein